jgi:hypothetical protein
MVISHVSELKSRKRLVYGDVVDDGDGFGKTRTGKSIAEKVLVNQCRRVNYHCSANGTSGNQTVAASAKSRLTSEQKSEEYKCPIA